MKEREGKRDRVWGERGGSEGKRDTERVRVSMPWLAAAGSAVAEGRSDNWSRMFEGLLGTPGDYIINLTDSTCWTCC